MNSTAEPTATPARILVIDDERRNRELLEVMLESQGYVVVSAGGSAEALEIMTRQKPDLILLDVMMPGTDGYQVTTILKGDAATSHIPIILLTSLDDRNSKAHGLRAGAEDVLTKPVNRTELFERVNKLLRGTAS
jgi:DNA-binding response OmpR family regulator